ncbi:MAG: hypothetical protein IT556_16325 [Acetobacteraceae bacterium]|nr:hypothetical protein [Acetobacteraceae bacterium]
MRRDFWIGSGHHLADRAEGGGLLASDDLLKAWLARPELVPPEAACAAERRLHAMLLADPRRAVAASEITAIADADARENFSVWLGFRDRLLRAPTIEAAYLDFARRGAGGVPVLFLQQLCQLVLRNALDGCEDPFTLRAAELFFRPQQATVHEGVLLLADAEIVEQRRDARQPGALSLLVQPAPSIVDLDVMTEDNAGLWWAQSDAHAMVLDFGLGRPGRDGLCRAMAAWIGHMLGHDVQIDPVAEMHDDAWRWFVGLDAEATRIGNALWRGETVEEADRARVLALFRLGFGAGAPVLARLAGRPVWMILARDGANRVVMKPQNLLVGLPLETAKVA